MWWRTSLILVTVAVWYAWWRADWKKKRPGPLNQINFFKINGITHCASTSCLKRATDSRTPTVCVLPWIVGGFIYIMMIFIYCGRGERMRICHNLNGSNSTPVPLNAHLWLAAFYCPLFAGAAGECGCGKISQPRVWPLILPLQAVAFLPSFLVDIYREHVLRNPWACDGNECAAWCGAGRQMQRDGSAA